MVYLGESIGSLFRVGADYDRRESCVKQEKAQYLPVIFISGHGIVSLNLGASLLSNRKDRMIS
jgi:hypothetical protein